MRVDVLAIASPGRVYDAMKAVAAEHARAAPPGFRVEFVYGGGGGGGNGTTPGGATLDRSYDVPENMVPGILDKSIAAMRAALDSADPPQYIVRTNVSTWFRWDRLAAYLETAHRTGLAAGYSPDHSHLCGCCIVLSADVARALVDFDSYDKSLIDDLAIAGALRRLGVDVQWIPRVDILADAIVGHGEEVGQDPAETCQVRVKHCLGGDDEARMRDASIMANLMRAYRRGTRDLHGLLHAGMAGIETLVPATDD
jgi:hypothetical protein